MYSEHRPGLYTTMRNSFIPVLSWSNGALPDDGSTACHSHRFSLPLWSLTLDPDRPTVPLWRGLRWSWSSPGCENRWWAGTSSRMSGCGWSWSWALWSQQPGINWTCRLKKTSCFWRNTDAHSGPFSGVPKSLFSIMWGLNTCCLC